MESVRAVGASLFSAEEAERLILSSADASEAARRLLERYREAGYLFAEADVSLEERALLIRVREGPRARLEAVEWAGLAALSEASAMSAVGARVGGPLHETDWEEGLSRLIRVYAENGRPHASVRLEAARADAETGFVAVRLTLDEGPLVRIESVRFEGLKKTRESVAARLLPIAAGDLYDQRKIDAARSALLHCGYFDSAHPALLERGASAESVRFRARVEEAKTLRAAGVLGYAPPLSDSEPPQLIGTLEASDRNLFGTGREAHFRWESGDSRSTRAGYREPFLFGSGIDLEARWESARADGSAREAGSVRFGWGASPRLRIGAGAQAVFAEGAAGGGLLTEAVWDARGGRESRYGENRSRENPSDGWLLRFAADAVAGGVAFQRFEASFWRFQPLWGRHTAAARFQFGAMRGAQIPPAERFWMGGADTLRGYRARAFQGLSRRLFTLEHRVLTGPRSRLFAFVDFGQTGAGPIRSGYGVGAALESRAGLAQIQYGVSPETPLLEGKIHIRLGAAF